MRRRWIVVSVALSFILGAVFASWATCKYCQIKYFSGVPVEYSRVASRREPVGWELRSQHFIYGMPRLLDDRYDFSLPERSQKVTGISVLVREGFVVGHCDRYKVPIWVAMRWSKYDLEATLGQESPPRRFREDLELPSYARASSSYKGQGRWDCGHMARNQDNLAYGEDNANAGCLMSNIVPQKPHLNEVVWNILEDEHRNIVRQGNIDTVWIICGSVFNNNTPDIVLQNGVGVPQACYKVIGWHDRKRNFHARGYLYPQDAEEKDPRHYLVRVDEIEHLVGIDFFPDLERDYQEDIESKTFQSLW